MKLTDNVLRSFRVAKVFRENSDKINCFDFSSNGETVISSSDDDSIVLYDCQEGKYVNNVLLLIRTSFEAWQCEKPRPRVARTVRPSWRIDLRSVGRNTRTKYVRLNLSVQKYRLWHRFIITLSAKILIIWANSEQIGASSYGRLDLGEIRCYFTVASLLNSHFVPHCDNDLD